MFETMNALLYVILVALSLTAQSYSGGGFPPDQVAGSKKSPVKYFLQYVKFIWFQALLSILFLPVGKAIFFLKSYFSKYALLLHWIFWNIYVWLATDSFV